MNIVDSTEACRVHLDKIERGAFDVAYEVETHRLVEDDDLIRFVGTETSCSNGHRFNDERNIRFYAKGGSFRVSYQI